MTVIYCPGEVYLNASIQKALQYKKFWQKQYNHNNVMLLHEAV